MFKVQQAVSAMTSENNMYEQKGVVSKVVVVTEGCSKLPNIAEVAGRVLKKQALWTSYSGTLCLI
ncbi:hypothetical protein [Anaplasma bovis]|uniref:hypothetical protein n=1 Tax=Anaplasma bovis TaxID=186733 RepID=UPI002FF2EB22